MLFYIILKMLIVSLRISWKYTLCLSVKEGLRELTFLLEAQSKRGQLKGSDQREVRGVRNVANDLNRGDRCFFIVDLSAILKKNISVSAHSEAKLLGSDPRRLVMVLLTLLFSL
jgi:hypothetical protein